MVADIRSNKWIKTLQEYLEPQGPNSSSEWYLRCPLHDDQKRSASLNVETWQWYCNACGVGGHVQTLIDQMAIVNNIDTNGHRRSKSKDTLDAAEVDLYHGWLMKDEVICNTFMARRGLNLKTLRNYQIGWHRGKGCYVIPIFDVEGELINLRFYDPEPKGDRRKIYSVAGHGEPVLYPINSLEEEIIVICEGELDALATIQNGIAAITRTAGATTWKPEWNEKFRDKTVYICHDMDLAGQQANQVVASNLRGIAKNLRVVLLPYQVEPKHGKDLTDFWLEGHTSVDFMNLVSESEEILELHELIANQDPTMVTVLESYDPDNFAKKLAMRVTITGRSQRPYLVPKKSLLSCDMGAGTKCEECPMKVHYQGEVIVEIKPYDPAILSLVNSNEKQRLEIVKDYIKPQKCQRLSLEEQEPYSVTEMFVRPAIDWQAEEEQKYVNRKIFCVGGHDTMPNSTVMVTGAIYANPRTSHNEFQAWEVTGTDTDLDTFSITKEMTARLQRFKGEPLQVLGAVNTDIAANITGIVGRRSMHEMMDLVFHSVLAFPFQDAVIERGWLEALIVGDTRTGKSEVANGFIHHYGVGELISCEGSSFAGVVGGLENGGGSKEWVVRWGVVPQNDRRLVVLDEVTGLSYEHIAQMSSIRSSGVAMLTKIQSEQAHARTRLVWLANPRGGGRIGDYTYGVQSMIPLIGSNEDVARFDMGMSVAREDVGAEQINSPNRDRVKHVYTEDLCKELIQWVWTRTPEDIVWGRGAEEQVLAQAISLSRRFWEDPPLVQGANIRIKLARLSVAMAARCFSTDARGRRLIVNKEHVLAASQWLCSVYEQDSFGYATSSALYFDKCRLAEIYEKDLKEAMDRNEGLQDFLVNVTSFSRSDIEGVLGVASYEANGVINTLFRAGTLTPEGMGKFKIETSLKTMLRRWSL